MSALQKIHQSFKAVRKYGDEARFKGYDPYDGLNSKLFQALPLIPKVRLFRLVWIQFFKRSPLDLRKFVGIGPEYNPKALGLFLSAYCIFYKRDKKQADLDTIHFLTEEIEKCQSKGFSGACWGYNFDWESRAFFQPKYTPTIVASSFIANAILDAYEITGDKKLLDMARSTCDFFLKDLNRTATADGSFAFSYSPIDKSVVYNASLLGARLMARIYSFNKEQMLADTAKKAVQFCADKLRADGSWGYGDASFHQWVDNFHTGYNLECIYEYMKFTGDDSYQAVVNKGFDYYINTFFTEEGIAKYYNNSVYPIDIHAPSQLVITLKKLDRMDEHKALLDKVVCWTIDQLQSPKGYFYYQINKYFTSKIAYMRWSQAWMVLCMGIYLDKYLPVGEEI
jgi:hypothetical protein